MAPQTAARQYIEPTDRSMPPVIMTNVAPTAMIAKNDVFLASSPKLSARKNLLTVLMPPVSRLCTSSEPPKMESNNPSASNTPSSPVSLTRGRFEAVTVTERGADSLSGMIGWSVFIV